MKGSIKALQQEFAVFKTLVNALKVCLESPEGEVEPLRGAIRGVDVGAVRVGLRGVRRTARTLARESSMS